MTDAPTPPPELEREHSGFVPHQDPDVIDGRALAVIGVAAIVIGAVAVLMAGVILAARGQGIKPSFAGPGGPKPAPLLLSHVEQTPIRESETGIRLRREQRRELEGWGWQDRDAGIARIPIDRAMDIVIAGQHR